jgi:hypothetical protein
MKSVCEKPKLFESSTVIVQPEVLTKNQVENEIENLYTTRSCPTGYKEQELKNCSIEELINLRSMTFEYLKFRSSKTRNVQFVHLIKRINQELFKRNVDTSLVLSCPEYSKSTVSLNTIFGGEYTLTKRLSQVNADNTQSQPKLNSESSIGSTDSKSPREKCYVIFTKYFTVKAVDEVKIPSFIHDIDLDKTKKIQDFDIISILKSSKNRSKPHERTESTSSQSNLLDESSYTSLDLKEEKEIGLGLIDSSRPMNYINAEDTHDTATKPFASNTFAAFERLKFFKDKSIFNIDFDLRTSNKPKNLMFSPSKRFEDEESYNFNWV